MTHPDDMATGKRIVFASILPLIFIFTGCATSRYTAFQDGKPLGEDNENMTVGLTMGATREFDKVVGSTGDEKLEFKDQYALTPLFSIDGQIGFAEHLDVGVGVGLDTQHLHAKLFGKICLFDQTHWLGLAFLPTFIFGGTFEEKEEENKDFRTEDILFFKAQLMIPVSYRINTKWTVSASPIFGREIYKANFKWLDNTVFKDTFEYDSWGLSIGFKRTFKNRDAIGYIFPELALVANELDRKFYPYFGIGIGGNEKSWR